MKKFIVILLATLFVANPALAKRWGKHHHHNRVGYYASDITAGIVGTAVGVMIAGEIMGVHKGYRKPQKPKVYIAEPEAKCYTIVSRKTGKVRQECVENASDEIIYVD